MRWGNTGAGADRLLWVMMPAHHDRLAALRADLGRLAAIAESQPARPHQPSVP
jgi:hypothetical protein